MTDQITNQFPLDNFMVASFASVWARSFFDCGIISNSKWSKFSNRPFTHSKYLFREGTLVSYVPLTWPTTNYESLLAFRNLTPIPFGNFKLAIRASYFAWLLVVWKSKHSECSMMTPSGPSRMILAPPPNLLIDPSKCKTQLELLLSLSLSVTNSSSFLTSFVTNLVGTWALTTFLGLKVSPYLDNSI